MIIATIPERKSEAGRGKRAVGSEAGRMGSEAGREM